jgi:hypothetical protein
MLDFGFPIGNEIILGLGKAQGIEPNITDHGSIQGRRALHPRQRFTHASRRRSSFHDWCGFCSGFNGLLRAHAHYERGLGGRSRKGRGGANGHGEGNEGDRELHYMDLIIMKQYVRN